MTPTILDKDGERLSVGDRVIVDGRDESQIVGLDRGYLGHWRVAHRWLTGFHPDEPNPTERTRLVAWNTYRCPDLQLATQREESLRDAS